MQKREFKQSLILYYSLFLLNVISYFVLNSVIETQTSRVKELYIHLDVISMITLIVIMIIMILLSFKMRFYGKKFFLIGIFIEISIPILVLFSHRPYILIIIVILNAVATAIMNVSIYIEISKIALREKRHAKVILTLFLFSTMSILFCAVINNIGLNYPIKLWIISLVIIILELINVYCVVKVFPREDFRYFYRHRRVWFMKSKSPSLLGVMLTAFCMILIASFVLQIYLRWLPNIMEVIYNVPRENIKITTVYFYFSVIISILFSRKFVDKIHPVKLLMFMQIGLILSVLLMKYFLNIALWSPSEYVHYIWQYNIIVVAIGFFIGSSVPLIMSTALTAYRLNQQHVVASVLVLGFVLGTFLGRDIFEEFIGIPMITSILAPVIILFLMVIYYDYLRKMQIKRIKQNE
ncbi:MAG: MFS transporter [Fusobacteria bacterium]|nr:MFS transporter [Fusobacteriota bacterium]